MRQKFNAIVTDQDMADTYLPPFRGCVAEAKGAAIMCSYNAVRLPAPTNKSVDKQQSQQSTFPKQMIAY